MSPFGNKCEINVTISFSFQLILCNEVNITKNIYMKQKSTGIHTTTIVGTQENTENGKHYAKHQMQTKIR